MTNLAATTHAIALSYDQVPYESRPFPQSHPARSAALAKFFGLNPPDVARARVLELGCAAGGNLIPLAMAFPDATFLGVDVSTVQIADGQARIAALGLTNVSLQAMSIVDVNAQHGTFDYVVCHGVYSWVPGEVRDAIMRIAHDSLTEAGVAYISYNVHPGWRLRGVLREAMMFHLTGKSDPTARVQAARAFLNELSELTDAKTAYGQMLRQEAAALATQEDYYIAHEYLEHTNDPCYVAEFIAKARAAGLEFLTEANFNITIAESFGPKASQMLRKLSNNQLDQMEQYIDFLTGRTFRQTLLVRQSNAAAIQRALSQDRLEGLHVQAKLTLGEIGEGISFVLRDANGRTLTTMSPQVRDALLHLGAQYPRSLTMAEIVEVAAPGLPLSAADAFVVRDAVFKLVVAGMADVTTIAVAPMMSVVEKPSAMGLARADAAAGKAWTTNMRHETVLLDVVARAVLPLLDGQNDIAALQAALEAKVRDGSITFQRDGKTLTAPDDITQSAREHVDHVLVRLAQSAVLVAA
jgi:methyltransferase-like protein/cyclopropane fatty-acyl-phospholipid synthase-like methyltransferase